MSAPMNEELDEPNLAAATGNKMFCGKHAADNILLTTEILALDACRTFEQVHAALLSISGRLGFDGFMYRGRFQAPGARHVERIESNYNPTWRQRYNSQQYAAIDPTVLHACSSLSPLLWSDDMYASEEQKQLKAEARAYGLAAGVTFPIHSRNGNFGLLSLSLAHADEEAHRHVRAMLTWGTLLAAMTHEAMGRIVKDSSAVQVPKLTQRQVEVLRWIAEGKSNWEIARLVDISEHGVSYHVRNILLKFNVGCRHRAIAQAQAYGLL
ncbi:MAG: helix-turn-helix transcriptional regulator [Gammaproteobacteria bacterium]